MTATLAGKNAAGGFAPSRLTLAKGAAGSGFTFFELHEMQWAAGYRDRPVASVRVTSCTCRAVGLGRGVRAGARRGPGSRGLGGEVDDVAAALGTEVCDQPAGQREHRSSVQVEYRVDELVVGVGQRHPAHEATDGVHDDMNPAEGVERTSSASATASVLEVRSRPKIWDRPRNP